jgi:hypothetical protein
MSRFTKRKLNPQIKVIDKESGKVLYHFDKGKVRIKDGVLTFPKDTVFDWKKVNFIIEDCIIEPLGFKNIIIPKPKPNDFKIGYEGSLFDLEVCPCCKGRTLYELWDEDCGGNRVFDSWNCEECGWSSDFKTCPNKYYLKNLIKLVKVR